MKYLYAPIFAVAMLIAGCASGPEAQGEASGSDEPAATPRYERINFTYEIETRRASDESGSMYSGSISIREMLTMNGEYYDREVLEKSFHSVRPGATFRYEAWVSVREATVEMVTVEMTFPEQVGGAVHCEIAIERDAEVIASYSSEVLNGGVYQTRRQTPLP